MASGKPIDLSRYDKDTDGTRVVTAISIIGIPTYPKITNPDDGTHLVHWRVHLRWDGRGGVLAKGSVVLDTYKDDASDPIVRIDVYSKPSLVSSAASKFWESQSKIIESDLTVQNVVDLITANGRERYKYDGNGSGCLSWSSKLLADYAAAGYVAATEVNTFTEFIAQTRTREEGVYWIPDDQGTYL
ncbi:hypothetical protein QCA50_000302 [Cerrena zonata]|uniref:DUF7770 domain-containing protein n=1 Tax=Cerrena zonata TaxID=2478898 RepID=A0AAW0GSN0_9APHY